MVNPFEIPSPPKRNVSKTYRPKRRRYSKRLNTNRTVRVKYNRIRYKLNDERKLANFDSYPKKNFIKFYQFAFEKLIN